MKNYFLTLLFALLAAIPAQAQVENYALQLTQQGSVDCGAFPDMNGLHSFTIQLWFKPTSWTKGAVLLQRGEDLKISLGSAGSVECKVGDLTLTATDANRLKAGQWQQLTLINQKGRLIVRVDNTEVAKQKGATPLAMDESLTIGHSYSGLIDEIRIFNKAIDGEFDYFWNNTLNEWNPYIENLLAYYKMDQEICPDNLADYKAIWRKTSTNHHGTYSSRGCSLVRAQNDKLPYLLNGAYTENSRFYDRKICREAYLLSNDIINLSIDSWNNGHLDYNAPCHHGALGGTAEVLEEYAGRTGVLSLDGNGWMEAPEGTLRDGNTYTIGAWIYIDEWTPGAKIVRVGELNENEGFSVQLGSDRQIEVYVDGVKYTFLCTNTLAAKRWVYVALSAQNGSTSGTSYYFSCGGSAITAASFLSTGRGTATISGAEGKKTYWGEGFVGKMDQLSVIGQQFANSALSSHARSLPMPGIGTTVSAATMRAVRCLYNFDKPERPGFDSYSQEGWLDIMNSAYKGYRGYQMRISVRSHDGWESTISNATYRKNFAQDLARLSEPFAGVELDLEWNYNDSWGPYGSLIDEIRAALPAGKTFMVSCHNVTYKFVPTNRFSKCDGFTFQQYGPQKTHFYFSTFQQGYNNFVNRGYPKNKIYLSYAATTSRLYDANENLAGTIAGVQWGALDQANYEPSATEADVYNVANGGHYYFTGPRQVYKRARFCTDNKLQGIFYWDMGNDVTVEHPYMLAKWASYGLNANVDPIFYEAKPENPAATGEMADDPDQLIPDAIELEGTRVTTSNVSRQITNGAYVALLFGHAQFEGKTWFGGAKNVESEDPECAPFDAIFQLERTAANTYRMRHLASGLYVGHSAEKGSGNFYTIPMCEDPNDSRVSEFKFEFVTGTGSDLYKSQTANLVNPIDQAHSTYPALKLNWPADFGYGGNNCWKVWWLYAFDAKKVQEAVSIDGVQVEQGAPQYFDLSGRRIARPTHGVYIVNGKKIVR